MKKFRFYSAVLIGLLLIAVFVTSCGRNDKAGLETPTAEADPATVEPPAENPTATAEAFAEATATTDPTPTASPASSGGVVPTEVEGIVINAEEAILYTGPGEDYPVVATVFGGLNYPVTGISEDAQWWRLVCYDGSNILIEDCWVSADPSVTAPTNSIALLSGSEIKPYIELIYTFLRALQSGLTAAGSEQYLSRDLQSAVEAGRPLPALFGIRDAFPSFVMSDFTDERLEPGAQVRVRFNFEDPTYAIVNLVQEEGEWRISNVAPHNLVKNYSTGELLLAEGVIMAYYRALANNEPEAAYELLAAGAQSGTEPDDLSLTAEDLEKLVVTSMQPVQAADNQISYYVRFLAEPAEVVATSTSAIWRSGDNARWLTMVRDEEGWRIAQIINSPILADVNSWQRVNILPINMVLDIPANWLRSGFQWDWSPNSLGMPSVGLNWVELDEFGGDESLLPRDRRDISTRPIDLGWAQGTQYSFELLGSPGEGSIASETHIIVTTGRRAYDFYAQATTTDELVNMQSILQRMVAAVSISDPGANAFNSVDTSVNFLATLLRDSTGASSKLYLGEALSANATDYGSILTLLDIDSLFQSFTASWLDNPAAGQARVGVRMYFSDTTEERIFTVERDSEGQWLIVDIGPRGQ